MRRLLAGLALAVAAAMPGTADTPVPENILVIEIAGQANGVVEIELMPEIAPAHVERVRTLARAGAYDGVVFHRVIDGFMAQTGDVEHGRVGTDPSLMGTGGSKLGNLRAEFSDRPFVRGTVGAARTPDPNSANSQFFIMFDRARNLDGQYTVWGQVLTGQDVVDAIARGERGSGRVAEPDRMERVYIKGER